jgi:2-keto-4-pentenoate hydratase
VAEEASMPGALEAAAARLVSDHATGAPFVPFAAEYGIVDLASAYDVQQRFVARLETRFGAGVGYKIGLTSKRMQAMCGIDQPIGGEVLERRVTMSGETVSLGEHGRAGIEFEIAARLGRAITAGTCPTSVEEMVPFVSAVAPAFEIVDDRNADYGSIDILSIVADNSWNAGAVLGPFKDTWPDLGAIRGIAYCNGAEIDRGHGRDVLGHPFEPLLWLGRQMTARGLTVPRGALVLTGSMIPTRFPSVGDAYRFVLDGLGDVEVAFTE